MCIVYVFWPAFEQFAFFKIRKFEPCAFISWFVSIYSSFYTHKLTHVKQRSPTVDRLSDPHH